jgi:triosephosphate isomerase (TIM)
VKRTALIAGNWKMNGHAASSVLLAKGIAALNFGASAAEVLIIPPFPYLGLCQNAIAGSNVSLGAQNMCAEPPGAYTGEVAGEMLVDLGCRYVLVGHSERRALFAESAECVARKFRRAQQCGLIPILCVGETLAQRQAGETMAVVASQLDAVIGLLGADALARSVLAYEPVWAIGTVLTASPEQAQEVHAALRRQMATYSATVAGSLRILYGGSVKGSNAAELLTMPDVDGALVGGASLVISEFEAIISAGSLS